MPSESSAEHRLMESALHDEETRRRTGISRQTAKEFVDADKHSDRWKHRQHVAQKAGMSPEIADLLSRA